jgi:diguanylate cyclase (GGDEF)-like protein
VLERSAMLDSEDMFVIEERLHGMIDRLVTECVVAYFDRATSELAYKARHDALTGLLNHAAFSRELEIELERAKRYDHCVTVVFFDFDKFKEINDTHGHQVGDAVLRSIAELLSSELRSADLAGRMGGDEFAAFLVESDDATATAFLARLHGGIDELIATGELPIPVTISAGLSTYPVDGLDAETLFRVADNRLYAEKRNKAA